MREVLTAACRNVLLIGFVLLAACADRPSALPASTGAEYSIKEAYDYPVKPGSEEWKALKSGAAKAAVAQIPEDILTNMTTDALVKSVLDYPLMSSLFAFNCRHHGFNAIYESFNGLRELANRSDAAAELERYQSTIPASGPNLERSYIKILLEAVNPPGTEAGESTGDVSNEGITPMCTDKYVTHN